IPCLSNNTLKFNYTRLKNFSQCAGVNRIRLYNYITQSLPIIAPAINITEHLGRILRPKDFLVKCPVCAVKSFFGWRDFDSDNEQRHCAREIQTYAHGWPQHARFCDEEDAHDEPDFCRLHATLRYKFGVTQEDNE
ncbi:hypothetical protein LOAG_14661, partial [Loa loa]